VSKPKALWLLVVPTTAPLLTPFVNRVDPVLLGVPFFYWYQFACALLAIVVITAVYLMTAGEQR
jgi:putative solute:sodium symporter small subunit